MPSKQPNSKLPDSLERLIQSNEPFSLDESLYVYRRLMAGLEPHTKSSWWKRFLVWRDNQLYASNPLQLRDYELKWRIHARKHYGWGFFCILLIQNGFVLWLVWASYTDNRLEDLAAILGVLVSGTLAETYFIFRIIVTELFKEIKYQDYINENKVQK